LVTFDPVAAPTRLSDRKPPRVLTNSVGDAHRDDPEFGYRLLADEVRAAGHRVSDWTGWRICFANGWWSSFGKKTRTGSKPGTPAHDFSLAASSPPTRQIGCG
jgi:hypothetical protein